MKLNSYELSRKWFDFCFLNPEKITPLHSALYMFSVEHCNRLGWKLKFGLPTEMAKEAIGVKSWHTYIKAFNDLVEWGFFILIERSKNQYSSNIIALIKYDEALDEALDKALTKHVSKHQRITYQSNDSIIKLITNNIEPITNNYKEFENFVLGLSKNETTQDPIHKPKRNYSESEISNIHFKLIPEHTTEEERAIRFSLVEKELITCSQWHETVSKATDRTEANTKMLIKKFLKYIKPDDGYLENIKDIKRYFKNWAIKQPKEPIGQNIPAIPLSQNL